MVIDDVVDKLVRNTGVNKRDATCIILVDGIQRMVKDAVNAAVSSLSALVDRVDSYFAIVIVAGTYLTPVKEVLKCIADVICTHYLFL